jgi:DNA-binding transcriptional LysR family regulator
MTPDFESLRIFCTAADATNFREAALRLAVSPQVVTRAVRELEDQIGEPLFHRSTRGVRLTDFGRAFADRARDALRGVEELFTRGKHRALSQHAGTVRVAAPGVLGRRLIPQLLAPLLTEHPGLTLDLRLAERHADLVAEKIDLGVRVGPMRDSAFVARSVGAMALHTVAAPSLIGRVGMPADIDALASLPVTVLIQAKSGRPWPWVFARNRAWVPAAPAFATDDVDAEATAALSGLGFCQMVGALAEPWLASGHLTKVLEAHDPPPWPVYVYRVQRSPVPARVRLVYDELIRVLRQ